MNFPTIFVVQHNDCECVFYFFYFAELCTSVYCSPYFLNACVDVAIFALCVMVSLFVLLLISHLPCKLFARLAPGFVI